MARTSTISVRVVGDTKGLDRGLASSQTKLQKFGAAMSKLRLPILLAGAASTKMAGEFDTSMSKIIGLVGIAEDEVDKMGESVRGLAGQTARSPTELADALFFVTSAGLRGATALDALEKSAMASAAGLGETKVVADLVTSAMNAYGAGTLDAGKATDILVATVREGKAEAPELAAAMGRVLPIAAELGVSFDQVGAATAAMTRTGTDAQTAATQLRQILASVIKPTKEAEQQLQTMGTSSSELRRKIRDEGLISALTELKELTEEYGEEAMGKVFPNIRALTGILDILGSNSEENVRIFERMTDTTGSLDAAFDAASQTIEFRFNRSLSEAKDAALGIRDPLTRLLGQLTPLFSGLSHEMKLTERAINAVADGVVDGETDVQKFAAGLEYADGVITDNTDTLLTYLDALASSPTKTQALIDGLDEIGREAGLSEEELELLESLLRGRLAGAMTDAEKRMREELNPALRDTGDAAGEGAEGVATLREEMLRLADPMFNAMKAADGADEAHRKWVETVAEYGEKSPQAEQAARDYALALQEAKVAGEQVDDGARDSFRNIMLDAGVALEYVNALIAGFNELNDAGAGMGELGRTIPIPGGNIEAQHEGGVVTGTPGSDQLRMLQAGERVTRRSEVNGSGGHGGQTLVTLNLQTLSTQQIREMIELARRQ